MIILNVAGGKEKPIEDEMMFGMKCILNVDTSYYSKTTPEDTEAEISKWIRDPSRSSKQIYLSEDIFKFLERTRFKFEHVSIYRFLEHVSFTNVLYFIYLISTVTEKGSIVDVIVPNYESLAKMILNEEKIDFTKDFDQYNIKLTTELLNEPYCPHASIWTCKRAKYFWELEGRFKVDYYEPQFNFDGRDIYLRFKAVRK